MYDWKYVEFWIYLVLLALCLTKVYNLLQRCRCPCIDKGAYEDVSRLQW